jgi:hypothetical protein
MTMAKRKKMVRQGDVLVIEGGKKTKEHTPVKDARGAVLAEGEATGHHHRIKMPGVTLLRAEGVSDAVLTVGRDIVALLEHEEHGTIEIGGGTHVVRRQREFDWAEKSSRRVAD